MGWLPLSFLRGKKLVALGLGGLSVACVLGPWGNSMESSFLASWVALKYLWICLQVGYHHIQLLEKPTIKVVSL